MSAAFAVGFASAPACLCCAEVAPRQCPEHYARELEPTDGTVAELQSLVVAMRHRGDPATLGELEIEMCRLVCAVVDSADPVDQIRHSMALAAVAVRYREEIRL